MNKKANAVGIGLIIGIILIAIFAPYIANLITNADDKYECQNAKYPIISTNNLLCTNASYGCCGTLKIMNVSFAPPLCTNSSGVLVANQSACTGFLVYNETSTDVGLTGTESGLLRLSVLFIILGLLFVLVRPVIAKK